MSNNRDLTIIETDVQRDERVHYMIASCRRSALFGVVIAVLTMLMASRLNLNLSHYAWIALVCLTYGHRLWGLNRIIKQDRFLSHKAENLIMISMAFIGCLWGASLFVFNIETGSAEHVATTIIVAAVITGGCLSVVVSLRSVLGFLTPATVGAMAYQVIYGGPSGNLLAITMFIYGLYLFGMSLQVRQTTMERMRSNQYLSERTQELERQIEATKRADAASEAKSQFLATMSHEIRTPMNGVLGFANILSDTDLDEKQAMCVETIQSSGQSLMVILNDILDVSKIEAGAMEIEVSPFALQQVMENCVALFNAQARAKNIDLATYVDPDLPESIMGDSERISQVLTNLINNAIKFTESGAVGVAIRSQGVTDDLHNIVVEVTDTGIGVAPDKLQKIFDRFSQADNSTTRQFGGTGLGLAISQQLTQLMGGQISIESELGKGSTFTITLPLAVTNPPAPTILSTLDMSKLRGKTALVVDDNIINLRYFEHQLTAYGITCETRLSAKAALELLARPEVKFDVAIIDHLMPVMDGFDFLEALTATQTHTRMALILSSSADIMTRSEAIERGFHGVVPKPIRQKDLLRNLHDCIQAATDSNSIETQTLKPALRPSLSQTQSQEPPKGLSAVNKGAQNKVNPTRVGTLESGQSKSVQPESMLSEERKDEIDALLAGLSVSQESSKPITPAQPSLAKVSPSREDVVTPIVPGQSVSAPPKVRVLLAEDNPVNRQLIELKLNMLHYTVDCANNGIEAVNAVKSFHYDIVLMDIRMPEMDGVEAARHIRNSGHKQANIPIVALTANVMSGEREFYLEAGMNDYVAKPVDFKVLLEKIEKWAKVKPQDHASQAQKLG